MGFVTELFSSMINGRYWLKGFKAVIVSLLAQVTLIPLYLIAGIVLLVLNLVSIKVTTAVIWSVWAFGWLFWIPLFGFYWARFLKKW